jgi:putative membrane protein insertion efficiency factor
MCANGLPARPFHTDDGRRVAPHLWPVIAALVAYKRWVSPWLPPACRFTPSCSMYALDAVRYHGLRGVVLAIGRLMRCQPFHPGGYDPVPGVPVSSSEAP